MSATARGSGGDAGAASMPVIRLDGVEVVLRGRRVLHSVTGGFEAGSLTAIVGANGAGKSTLLKAVMGLVPLACGDIELAVERQRIAYLAQQSGIERSFPLSVLDCVLLGFWPRVSLWRRVGREQRERALEALAGVGLADVAERPVGALSAGQFQRMLFVRVQLQDAGIILLDEPFNAVDARTTDELLEIVARWHGEGRTVAAVLHDHAQVRAHFPSTLLLAQAPVAWGDTDAVLCAENLRRAGNQTRAWDARAA
ncbi:ABC transporter ATP-binding protein [Verticiella sediminum]